MAPIDERGIPGFSRIKNRARWLKEGEMIDTPKKAQYMFQGRGGPIPPPDGREIKKPVDSYDHYNSSLIGPFFVSATNQRAHIELARGEGNYVSLGYLMTG